MKGLIFIALIYFSVLLLTIAFKFLKDKIFSKTSKNKGEETPSPKIYYIKNYSKKEKSKPLRSPNIAIKGTIISKEKTSKIN